MGVEDDVLDLMPQGVAGSEPLPDDLGGTEVPDQAHLRRLAESTSHRASDLTGDTQRPGLPTVPLAHRDQDRFGLLSLLQAKGELDRCALLLEVEDRGRSWAPRALLEVSWR